MTEEWSVDEVMKKFSTYADERSGKINRVGVELSVRNLFYLHIQDRPQLGNELQTLVEERMSGEEIGYKEFLTILAIANRHVEETGLKNAFILIARKNKANNNKQVEELHVDFTAIKSLMKNLIDNGFTDSELDAMVKEADTDGSGTIEIDEFVNYLLGTEEDLANEIKLFSGELPCQSKVDD